MTREVHISRQPVELYKILKFEGLAENGGAAKLLVAHGQVRVNGEIETRKRRKIMSGDCIEFEGETLQVFLTEQASAS